MLFRKKVVLAKIEATEGTDAAPTGANAILTRNLSITPLAGAAVRRDTNSLILGNDLQIHVGSHVTMNFEVEIAGSGAAGTAPAYGPLLRACGMAETIDLTAGSENVNYLPVSSGFESATLYFHLDGQKHAMVGARGTFSIGLSPSGIPAYKFGFTGLWVDPASVADPTPDWSAFQDPLAVSNANTPTFTLHGGSHVLEDLSIDLANQVVYRNVVGGESVQITDRAPAGRVTIEAPALSAKNFFTTAKANATGALQLVHGTAAGQIVQIDAPNVQLLDPQYGESDGVATLQMGLSLIPSSAGDDELKITVK